MSAVGGGDAAIYKDIFKHFTVGEDFTSGKRAENSHVNRLSAILLFLDKNIFSFLRRDVEEQSCAD